MPSKNTASWDGKFPVTFPSAARNSSVVDSLSLGLWNHLASGLSSRWKKPFLLSFSLASSSAVFSMSRYCWTSSACALLSLAYLSYHWSWVHEKNSCTFLFLHLFATAPHWRCCSNLQFQLCGWRMAPSSFSYQRASLAFSSLHENFKDVFHSELVHAQLSNNSQLEHLSTHPPISEHCSDFFKLFDNCAWPLRLLEVTTM